MHTLILLLSQNLLNAQDLFNGLEHLFTIPENYIARFTDNAPVIDGVINSEEWDKAVWSNDFVDIEGDKKPIPTHRTRMKMLWNDTCLYIATEMVEPHVWATLKNHDDIIFRDNDFEVFIDPDNNTHQYYEIEVNAFNTIFDLLMPRPYNNGGNAIINWNLAKLRSAISIKGTLNKSHDKDKSWSVEMAIPFRSVYIGTGKGTPREGQIWRVNFSRVEWNTDIQDGIYVKSKDSSGRNRPEHNWVWSQQGIINMHQPERWGYVQFTRRALNEKVNFELPYAEKQKKYLWLCYYRQRSFSGRNRKYAVSFQELGIDTSGIVVDGKPNSLQLEATSRQFMVTIQDENNNMVSINDEGLIRYSRNR